MTDDEAEALLERVKQQDLDAFEALYLGLTQKIVWAAQRVLWKREDAEEIVTETMLVVWDKAGEFEGRSSVKTWVVGIAKNKALEAYRKRKRFPSLMPGNADDPDLSSGEGGGDEWPTGDDFVELLERAQDAEQVRRCVAKLSPKHRDIVMMRYYGDMKEQEIAEIMDIPLGAVKSGNFYAKRKLKKCLQCSNAGHA